MLVEEDEYDSFLTNLNSFKGIEQVHMTNMKSSLDELFFQVLLRDFQERNNPALSIIPSERSPNAIEVINR